MSVNPVRPSGLFPREQPNLTKAGSTSRGFRQTGGFVRKST